MSVWRKTPFCGAIRRVFIFRKNLSELTELVEFARRERRGQLDVPVDFFGKVEKGDPARIGGVSARSRRGITLGEHKKGARIAAPLRIEKHTRERIPRPVTVLFSPRVSRWR